MIIWRFKRECLHQRVVRNTIFRKAPPSVVSGYGKRSINLNKVVANFEKHIFLSQTDLTRTGMKVVKKVITSKFRFHLIAIYALGCFRNFSCTPVPSCNNVALVTNLCLGREWRVTSLVSIHYEEVILK
jgi:hypothetical protein